MTATLAIVDNAFSPDLAEAILARALENEASFQPTLTYKSDNSPDTEYRRSLKLLPALDTLHARFVAEAQALFPALCRDCGMPEFAVADMEIELAAHRDGHYYRPHLDIRFGKSAGKGDVSRTLSMVAYFHRQPAGFSGGEIRIVMLDGEEVLVEPRHNRIAAFPSILLHEVLPVSVPGDAFADARFSINCWFRQ